MSEQIARATKKQQLLLSFVRDFIKEHDYGPSYREIMSALEYKSVSTVAVHVDGLIAKGFLRRADNSPRSLEVVNKDSEPKKTSDSEPMLQKKARELIKESHNDEMKKKQATTLIEALEILGNTEAAASLRILIEKG